MRNKNDNLAIFCIMVLMIEYELVKHDKMKGLRVFINSIRMRSIHMHHDLELLYVLKGKGTIIIKDVKHQVVAGDTILINAFDSHEIISESDALTVIIIQFSNHFLKDYFHHLKNTIFIDIEPKKFLNKKDYFDLVSNIISISKSYIQSKSLFELVCIQRLSNILYLLFENLKNEELSEAAYGRRKKQLRRINRISSYINSNYQDQIRLQDIAEMENITITHLSHIITEYFGMTFQEYLKDKRLECALRLIGDSSLSLSDISEVSGFSELKYMTQAFKDKFGVTPKHYRANKITIENKKKKTDLSEYIYTKDEAISLLKALNEDYVL